MSLVAKFATVGGATMASRVLGFVREALIAATLGAGPVADAFYAAFSFPNLFRRVLGEGAFNSAFVPLFAKELEAGGKEQAKTFAEQVLSVLIVFLIALTALAMIFMPFLVSTVVAPGFAVDPEKFDLTVFMTRVMFPYLFAMSLVAALSGILNSMRRYFLAAFMPVLLNVLIVLATLLAMFMGFSEFATGHILAWAVFIAGFVQLGTLWLGVTRENFHLNLKRPKMTPAVKRLLVLMGPAVLAGGVVQINIMVGRIIASGQDGAIALLNYADRINQLPLGVIGIAVGVVLLPELARALKAGKASEAQHLQNRSLEFALGLTLPATIGFIMMPIPIVNILFERGAFSPTTTLATAAALVGYASGLPAYVMEKVLQPVYYAREDMKTPLYFSVVSVVTNIAISLIWFPIFGYVAIAFATAISSWIKVILLGGKLWISGDFKPSDTTLKRIVLMVFASLVMGAFLWTAQNYGSDYLLGESTLIRIISVLAAIGVASIIYFALIIATGAFDAGKIKRLIKR